MRRRAARSLLLASLCLALALASAACQRGSGDPAPAWKASPFGRDVDRICNAEVQSGADKNPYANRDIQVAMWLGEHIETDEGRNLLASLSPLPPLEKLRKLDATAAEVGLTGCPTARSWGGPPAAATTSPAP